MPGIPSPRRTVAKYLLSLVSVLFAFSCDQGHQTASGLQCDPHPVDIATRDFADAFAHFNSGVPHLRPQPRAIRPGIERFAVGSSPPDGQAQR